MKLTYRHRVILVALVVAGLALVCLVSVMGEDGWLARWESRREKERMASLTPVSRELGPLLSPGVRIEALGWGFQSPWQEVLSRRSVEPRFDTPGEIAELEFVAGPVVGFADLTAVVTSDSGANVDLGDPMEWLACDTSAAHHEMCRGLLGLDGFQDRWANVLATMSVTPLRGASESGEAELWRLVALIWKSMQFTGGPRSVMYVFETEHVHVIQLGDPDRSETVDLMTYSKNADQDHVLIRLRSCPDTQCVSQRDVEMIVGTLARSTVQSGDSATALDQ